ncbi:MAG TPA: OsmC family protein [Nitrososphaerales archaeon]|nr:OsmC family protein [Nitrososphaerales archaeon]
MSHQGSASVRFNNVDLTKIKQSASEFEKEDGHHYVEKVIRGEYNLEGAPTFLAEAQTDHTKFILTSDEPAILGGLGVHTSPLTYVLYGTMACFANTLAIVCAEKQVPLKILKITGKIHYDIGPLLTDSNWPLIKELILEVVADKDIANIIEEAREKCPSVYVWSHPIKTEILQVAENKI